MMMKALSLRSAAFIVGLALGAAACAAPSNEAVGSSNSALDSRFDANYPAPHQVDDWSCSVHTTTWMLQATGHDVTWSQIASHMRNTGRVSPAVGLMDSNGPGVAATLRDFATGGPSIANQGVASFDEVAAKAGHMAVGIGGRGWYHWTAVRGYDADRDVILLANSAPGYKGVGQQLSRGQFSALGSMAMVWMDFGQVPDAPPAPPFSPSPKPAPNPFPALHVKGPIPGGHWLTQCNESHDGERVWQAESGGPDPETRWAAPKYPQSITADCGTARDGQYPVVLRNFNAGEFGGTWITHCTGNGDGVQRVFHVDGDLEGHPSASFQYNEQNTDCE